LLPTQVGSIFECSGCGDQKKNIALLKKILLFKKNIAQAARTLSSAQAAETQKKKRAPRAVSVFALLC
jgi:hypothetical protein